jgi:predicted DNA-binding transcriptional regulator AlpA
MATTKATDKLVWRTADVLAQLGIVRKTLYNWQEAGNFPQRRRFGPGTVGWLKRDVLDWLESRPCVAPRDKEGSSMR